MQRDSDGMPNELQRALLEYTPTDLEEALIEWTREHWPMAARSMVYNKAEGDNMVSGVQGVRSDEGQLVMSVAARVAISERELLIRALAALLPLLISDTVDMLRAKIPPPPPPPQEVVRGLLSTPLSLRGRCCSEVGRGRRGGPQLPESPLLLPERDISIDQFG